MQNGKIFEVREVRAEDNSQIANLIRGVLIEFGAVGPGYAHADPELDVMFQTYTQPRTAYFVVTDGARILGGAGFAPLEGTNGKVCELRKMYFLNELRGLGYGRKLLEMCLNGARKAGFETCYLETIESMTQACALYEKLGFQRIPERMGTTGHFNCHTFYSRRL